MGHKVTEVLGGIIPPGVIDGPYARAGF
jgi:hypothetical protein